jgi:predicted TIM-barrel fold metal-dependent hydrolase
VLLDIATLEGVGGIAGLIQNVSPNQVVFGSHFPLFSLESAVLKMRESELTADQTAAISHGNAQRMLAGINETP